jgi:tryptophan synthase alpha chain
MTEGGERIRSAITKANLSGRPAVAAFLTAGFPSRATFCEQIRETSAASDVLEIGVPFSDPMADGLAIQRSSQIALRGGSTLSSTLAALGTLRSALIAPVVLMSYVNPLLAYGVSRLARDAAEAGVAGFIVPDLPFEEQGLVRPRLVAAGIALIQMVTPMTPNLRIQRLCAASEGFVYAVTRTGTTGGPLEIDRTLDGYLARVCSAAERPVLAGFGVRTRDDVAALVPPANGVVVGSALLTAIERGMSPTAFLAALRTGPVTS